MGRKKVNLQWIDDELTRQATLKKRQASLMKKASELATLCGIKASVVVYEEGNSQPEVWPSVPETRQLLNRFNAIPDHLENYKKVLNLEDYLHSRISQLRHQVTRSDHENSERETLFLQHQTMAGQHPSLSGLNIEELTSLGCMVETKIKIITDRFPHLLVETGRPLQESPAEPTYSSPQEQAPNNIN